MSKLRVLAGLIAASFMAASSAYAAPGDAYYVVVPVKGKAAAGQAQPAIKVVLSSNVLPQAAVGVPYSGVNLNTFLVVTGDPAFTGAGVSWALVSGSLPAGLTLNSDGTISGTPTAAGSGVITARATYRTANGEQSYQVIAKAVTAVLQVSPSAAIAFAKTTVGKATRVSRTVTNAGDGPATALAVAPPQGYVVDKSACPASLPAGGSCTLQIDFVPDEPRSYGGEIVVSSGNNGWATIPVSGTGLLAGPTYSASHFYAGTNTSGVAVLYNEGPGAVTITDCKRTPAGGGAAVNCTAKDAWPATWPEGVAMQAVVPSDTYYISLDNGQKVVWQPQSQSVTMQ